MSRYTVTAERSGKWWALQTVEVPNALSQARRLDQAYEITEAIAWITGEPESEIEITVVPVLPDDARLHLDEATRLRTEAAMANAESARESRAAVRALRQAGLSVRDIGTVLGVSFQRAHQLLSA